MNKRQVIILWVIAIALGAAVAAVKLTQKDTTKSATTRAAGQTLFESFPATDVATVEIQGAAGSVTLAKKDGKWTVAQRDGYPANTTYVNEFIRTLNELKVTRGMEAGPSFAPRFGMDESATKAEDRGLTATFKDASGKELAKVSLGKNIESGADAGPMGGGMSVGRYIRNHADESGFYAISEMFPSVSAEIPRWLADDFISPEKIKSITLSQKGKDDTAWKLTRETEDAEFKLEGAAAAEVLDTTATSPLKSLFSYARFEDVVPADKVAERADAAGKRSAVIETFEGFIYTLTITPVKAAPIGQTAASMTVYRRPPNCPRSARRRKARNPKTPRPRTPPSPTASRPSPKNSPRKKHSPAAPSRSARPPSMPCSRSATNSSPRPPRRPPPMRLRAPFSNSPAASSPTSRHVRHHASHRGGDAAHRRAADGRRGRRRGSNGRISAPPMPEMASCLGWPSTEPATSWCGTIQNPPRRNQCRV